MDKVVKREVKLSVNKEVIERVEQLESGGVALIFREPHPIPTEQNSFWNSYPIEELTPTQREHFKAIMRKEVRRNGN